MRCTCTSRSESPCSYCDGPADMAECPRCGEEYPADDGVTSNESAAVLLCRACATAEEMVGSAPTPSMTSDLLDILNLCRIGGAVNPLSRATGQDTPRTGPAPGAAGAIYTTAPAATGAA